MKTWTTTIRAISASPNSQTGSQKTVVSTSTRKTCLLLRYLLTAVLIIASPKKDLLKMYQYLQRRKNKLGKLE